MDPKMNFVSRGTPKPVQHPAAPIDRAPSAQEMHDLLMTRFPKRIARLAEWATDVPESPNAQGNANSVDKD
jgi:hypothetical protein